MFSSGELLAVGNCGQILGTRVVRAKLVNTNCYSARSIMFIEHGIYAIPGIHRMLCVG